MTRLRLATLKRLVQITTTLYRQQAADVARLKLAQTETQQAIGRAAQVLDEDIVGDALMAKLSICRVSSLRQLNVQSQAELQAHVEAATTALAIKKGVEVRLASEQENVERATGQQNLDDFIETAVRSRASRLE